MVVGSTQPRDRCIVKNLGNVDGNDSEENKEAGWSTR